MKSIKHLIWKLLRILKLAAPVEILLKSFLIDEGWFKSYYKKESVDKNGNPIPWYAYSAIKFLEPRLNKQFTVFEYGCGNSTLWYANRVNTIKSVEHDEKWYTNVNKKLASNAEIVLRELKNGNYSKEILTNNKKYNIIVVDGRDRNNCIINCIHNLTEDGIIVFDNTQVPEYSPSLKFLKENNFKSIDFIGPLPIVTHGNTTSIFYRENNCLNI